MTQKKRETMGKKTPRKPEVLMHFTDLEGLFRMFELGGIPLYDASRWDDVCDSAMVERGCKEIGVTRFGVLCLMKSDFASHTSQGMKDFDQCETYAHWKAYTKSVHVDVPLEAVKMGVRIDFKIKGLVTALESVKSAALLSPMSYFSYKDYKDFSKTLDGEKSALLRKRAAYLGENEVRLLVFDQKLSKIPITVRRTGATAFIPVSNWKSLIRNIVFSPLCKMEKYPGSPDVDQIRYYAEEALNRRRRENKYWSTKAELACRHLLKGAYRSGILDNEDVLNAIRDNKYERLDLKKDFKKAHWSCAEKKGKVKRRK